MNAPTGRPVKVRCPMPHHLPSNPATLCATCGGWLSKDPQSICVTLGPLDSARLDHSEACEAESVAWDAYNAHLESRGRDADTASPLFKAWSAAGKVRMRTLDAVLRAKEAR